MLKPVPSYAERRAQIKTIDDLETQLKRAQRYAKQARNAAKKADRLDLKIQHQNRAKQAESVLRLLRSSYFDIEDELASKAQ